MNLNGFEIERKFLIKYPTESEILSHPSVRRLELEQTYLTDKRRVRKIKEGESFTYIVTYKEKITDVTRIERESELSKEEFEELLKLRNPALNTIFKTRYCIPFEGKLFELDVFPFWNDRAFLEIELESEDETFNIPPFIEVIKEVTNDVRYRNSALAKEIFTEEI